MTDVLGMPLEHRPPPRRRSRTVMAVVFLTLVVLPVALLPIAVAMADHPAPAPSYQPRHL